MSLTVNKLVTLFSYLNTEYRRHACLMRVLERDHLSFFSFYGHTDHQQGIQYSSLLCVIARHCPNARSDPKPMIHPRVHAPAAASLRAQYLLRRVIAHAAARARGTLDRTRVTARTGWNWTDPPLADRVTYGCHTALSFCGFKRLEPRLASALTV